MKRCPKCQQTYADDEMRFCLEDGTALVSVAAEQDADATWVMPAERGPDTARTQASPTQASPSQSAFYQAQPSPPPIQSVSYAQSQPTARRRSPLLWILAAALMLGLSGIVVVALILYSMRGDQTPLTAQTATPTPAPTVTPTPETISSAANSNSNKTASTPTPTPSSTPTARQMNTNNAVAQPSPTPPKPLPTPKPSPLPTPTAPSKPIAGGVLNGKAISLPKPAYPPIARAAHASGTVIVQITIDENGSVISARAVSGHPLLQGAAVAAARGAKFSPTTLSGQPVKVTGVITYNFVAQ
ncbi:MAG: TonB family protein [Pyrinomonadaceae bacterium]